MQIKGKLSSAFNILSGKKGIWAAVTGYAAVAEVGFAVFSGLTAAPLYAGLCLVWAGICVDDSRKSARNHDKKSGPKI